MGSLLQRNLQPSLFAHFLSSCISSKLSPLISISFLILSIHLVLGLPLGSYYLLYMDPTVNSTGYTGPSYLTGRKWLPSHTYCPSSMERVRKVAAIASQWRWVSAKWKGTSYFRNHYFTKNGWNSQGNLNLHLQYSHFSSCNILIKKKLNLWLTAPKGATPVN